MPKIQTRQYELEAEHLTWISEVLHLRLSDGHPGEARVIVDRTGAADEHAEFLNPAAGKIAEYRWIADER